MEPTVYPIDLKPHRTRWIGDNDVDARAYAAALTTAGIDYSMHYVKIDTPAHKIEQWVFDRLSP